MFSFYPPEKIKRFMVWFITNEHGINLTDIRIVFILGFRDISDPNGISAMEEQIMNGCMILSGMI